MEDDTKHGENCIFQVSRNAKGRERERDTKEAIKSQNEEDGILSASTNEEHARLNHLRALYGCAYSHKPLPENLWAC